VKIERLREIHNILTNKLRFITNKMAKFINLRRSERLDLRERGTVYLLRINIKTKRKSDKLNFKKLELFKIKKELRPVIFKLKLLKEIKIHLVFYTALLKPALKKILIIKIQEIDPES
jgi:hypothetical protein